MSIYTVHAPALTADESAPDPQRFAFVRDGFSFWAFLLAPLWMLRYRLWLVFVGYVIVTAALQVGLRLIGASAAVITVAGLLVSLLVGFEAATLRRFTLARRGWRNLGIVVGDDLESAERRFFDAWTNRTRAAATAASGEPRPPSAPAPAMAGTRRPPPPDIVGLFPQPGASR